MAFNLFGVTLHDAHTGDGPPGVELVTVRHLAAICGRTEYRAIDPDDKAVRQYADVIATFAASGPVLPAPVGIIFRSADSVQRWLELHYSALTEAIGFVDNRVAARVHAHAEAVDKGSDAPSGDLVSSASEGLRALRRAAVATLPMRADKANGVLSSAAFLVEELNWKDFVAEVQAQERLTPNVRFELTGPWPPYDFVKMQLGA